MEHVNAIRAAGATVLFDVDATQLNKCKEVRDAKGRWDRVVFNFPHVGALLIIPYSVVYTY